MHSKLTRILSVVTLFFSLIPISSFAATTADEYYRQGCEYYEQQKFDEAAKAFEKAVELNPDNADYHYNLGTTYCNLGKYEEALKHLKKAVKLAPESQAGKLAKEQIGEIEKYLRKVKEQETTETGGWHQPNISTKSVRNDEQQDEAIPQQFRRRYNLYQEQIRTCKEEFSSWKEMMESNMSFVHNYPVSIYNIEGNKEFLEKMLDSADEYSNNASEKMKHLLEARYKLGLLYLEMGRREMAREQFEEIIHNGWSNKYSEVDKAAEELDKLGSR